MDNQSKEKLQSLAAQLAHPEGEKGIEIGQMMNETNIGMTLAAVEALDLIANDHVLELGHGNCGHLRALLNKADQLQYTGLEISATMQQQAIALNIDLIKQFTIDFMLFNGTDIPFSDTTFTKIFTVNTIYFWQNPLAFLQEIYRVLDKKGLFAICFAQKEFMQTLPFTKHGFKLYDTSSVENLVRQSTFHIQSITDHSEQVRSKNGEQVTRIFTVFVLSKGRN